MAEQLKLVQRNDFTADISTLNLLNFADGFETAEDGYKSQDAGEVNGPVWETISLMADRYRSRKLRLLSGLVRRLGGKGNGHEAGCESGQAGSGTFRKEYRRS